MMFKPLLTALLVGACLPASAALVTFDLTGKGGNGLLGSNENQTSPVVGGGSGGEMGMGIVLDSDTNMLTINVGWGSGNGFTDLTGALRAGHIHGSTDPGPAGFLQNRGVVLGLDGLAGFDPSATDGGFVGSVLLSDALESALLEGQLYLNFHTARFPGGEIRGQIVQMPEPATLTLALASLALMGGIARRRQQR